MRTLPLNAFPPPIVLSGTGAGQCQIGPVNPREIWYPTSVAISCSLASPSGSTPRCFIYAGASPTQQFFVDATYGIQGNSSSLISGQVIYPGMNIYAVVTGGPPGAQFVMTVMGSRVTP
jgi:hypothetical protein